MDGSPNTSELKAKGKALLTGALKHVQAAALAAALVPLGTVAVMPAEAGVSSTDRRSHVVGTVTGTGPDLYSFTVFNDSHSPNCGSGGACQLLVDWELPIFHSTDVSNLTDPFGWAHEILANPASAGTSSTYYHNPSGPYGNYQWNYNAAADPNSSLYPSPASQFNNPAFIIHWYACDSVVDPTGCGLVLAPLRPIGEGRSLSGFSFLSAFAPTAVPYQASWLQQRNTNGDPPAPGAPGAAAPNNQQPVGGVPEPASFLLLASGGGLLWLVRRRMN